MRVCYFFAQSFPEAVATLPPIAELVYTGGCDHAYWVALTERWTGEDDLIVIEQDIVINERVIPEFALCDKDWCTFPYRNGVPSLTWDGVSVEQYGSGYLVRSLGCTRFSADLQKRVTVDSILFNSPYTAMCDKCTSDLRCWCHLDIPIYDAIMASGMTDADTHIHNGEVGHLKQIDSYDPEAKLSYGFWDVL